MLVFGDVTPIFSFKGSSGRDKFWASWIVMWFASFLVSAIIRFSSCVWKRPLGVFWGEVFFSDCKLWLGWLFFGKMNEHEIKTGKPSNLHPSKKRNLSAFPFLAFDLFTHKKSTCLFGLFFVKDDTDIKFFGPVTWNCQHELSTWPWPSNWSNGQTFRVANSLHMSLQGSCAANMNLNQ